jgi:hypothetical protein
MVWWTNQVKTRLVDRGYLDADQDICMIASGTDDVEWAIIDGGYIYPTCVQAGNLAKTTTTLIPNTDDGSMSPNKQSNLLQFSDVFVRNNYIAPACPWIQPICAITQVNSWWLGNVQSNVVAYGGTWDDKWEDNLCIGEDDVVRYVTATGFVNTCTGFNYEEGKEKETQCGSQPLWQCGFKTYSPYTNLSPGFPVNQFRSIARAMIQEDKLLPECSFANNNFCNADFPEQDEQPRYRIEDKDTICASEDHPQYHATINSVRSQIISKQNAVGDPREFDLCYLEDQDGDLEYLLFVDGVGYPTCVSAPMTEADCPTDKFYCVEEQRNTWPGTIYNRMRSGFIISDDLETLMRKNHQHYECPSIRDICLPGHPSTLDLGGLSSSQQKSFIPSELGNVNGQQTDDAVAWFNERFANNICVGRDSAIRFVTPQGIQSTCVGYLWDTENMPGEEQLKPCPTSRNFMCGSLQIGTDGRSTYGWLSAQTGLVQEALRQTDANGLGAVHPQCPYTQCREC